MQTKTHALVLALCLLAGFRTNAAEVYVALGGKDSMPGTEGAALGNASGSGR